MQEVKNSTPGGEGLKSEVQSETAGPGVRNLAAASGCGLGDLSSPGVAAHRDGLNLEGVVSCRNHCHRNGVSIRPRVEVL